MTTIVETEGIATDTFQRFFPVEQQRTAVAQLFAHAITEAHEVSPSCWVVTMFDDYFQLNVGPVEMITAYSAGVRLLLRRSADWPAIEPLATDVGDYGSYRTAKDARLVFLDAQSLPALIGVLKNALTVSVRAAARARVQTTWGNVHSDALLNAIESFSGEQLPKPLLSKSENGVTHPDPYMVQMQLEEFIKFVAEKSGGSFGSFASNPYIEAEEGYKYDVHRGARAALQFQKWKESDIGSGRIIEKTIQAIEVPKNNLVQWDSRRGEATRPHRPLFDARMSSRQRESIERSLFALYRRDAGESQFRQLVEIFGARYPIIAYLFFLKDNSRFLPIAPETFDKVFACVGVTFKTSHRCSWENYSQFLSLLREIRVTLAETLGEEVTLLDAHSFLWILGRQMRAENRLVDLSKYSQLSDTERTVLTKTRVHQDLFRQNLLAMWQGECAVTRCGNAEILDAAHIKPWNESDATERIDLHNGFLLTPALHRCFDRGYITFDDRGMIVVSERLADRDMAILGIDPKMRLRRIDDPHRKYLKYHRDHIFR